MDSCTDRIEKLLNRAGQTISDLPKREGTEASEPYPLSALPKANGAAWNWYLNIGADMDDYDSTRTKMVLKMYILHLTDIIDRMEWALENVCGERDWLRFLHCEICDMEPNGASCKYCNVKIGGVPEDRRVDDEQREAVKWE